MNRLISAAVAAGIVLTGAVISPALAQDFPNQPIRLVVPLDAGGGTDTTARVVAQALGERLPHPVVVENLPGASGMIGAQEVLGSTPDGHTLLFEGSNVTLLPQLRDVPYRVGEDLLPVAMLIDGGTLLLVASQLPIQSIEELIAYGKANPGGLSYGSSGVGTASHLAGATLAAMAGIEALHVPYSGSSEFGAAAAAGIISMAFVNPEAAQGLIDSGRVRAIAASGLERIPSHPDLPTVREAGLPEFNYTNWMGVFAPRGTPEDIILTLNGMFNEAVHDQAVLDYLEPQGKHIRAGTPADFAAVIADDLEQKAQAVEIAGLR